MDCDCMPKALSPVVHEDATTVRARRGTTPFFVKRSCAEVAPVAERRAFERAPIGTSRLITPVADCTV